MKSKICVCGHNSFSHEDKWFQWVPFGKNLRNIKTHYTACMTENCRCEWFEEKEKESRQTNKT